MSIKRDDLEPGDRVSVDQYKSSSAGRLPNTYGRETSNLRYKGGSIFVDHATGYIYIHNQVSLNTGSTLAGKHAFEEFADEYNVKLKRFHADNHPFNSREFHRDLELQDQTITFSAVGAHHQNGVAERNEVKRYLSLTSTTTS